MSDLYESDIFAWSERQGELLRRVAAGERVNERDLDWPNIIDEVESVGSEQLHAVETLLRQALVHMLKAQAWPEARDAPNWEADAIGFRTDAAARYAPSMRQKLDLDRIYRSALRALPRANDGMPPGAVPPACPFTLDELLAVDS